MESKSYYSLVGLSMPVTQSSYMTVDGQSKLIQPRYIQFARIGQDKFFMFTTNEPEVQEVLDRRIVDVGDIFGPEEYNRLAVPAEMRAKAAADENKRLMGENNRLLALLNERTQSKEPAAPPPPPSSLKK